MKRPSVFDYLDFRRYLNDMFHYRKTTKQGYSYRVFSARAGFASPNFLKLVIEKKRNLTCESIAKVARGFSLKKPERIYFENLVFMNQASEHELKDYYYKKLLLTGTNGSIKKLAKTAYNYFSQWYYPAIRELVSILSSPVSAKKIARLLNPAVPVAKVEKALSDLSELGLLNKDGTGSWKQADTIVSTGPEVESVLVANFHKKMMALAAESIDRFAAADRDISGLTLSIPQGRILELKDRIALFRKELLTEFASDPAGNSVVQINVQMFPLTRSRVDKGE
ncbi:MAG: TIGR02147 family protein [Deltaproteobacteria bacterium]|nr:TIGR02147 family protein [Deltaproteobacteria bacterium]